MFFSACFRFSIKRKKRELINGAPFRDIDQAQMGEFK